MAEKIDTVAARKALQPRPAPYFQRLETGGYIGYRKLATGDGTWVARWRDAEGKQTNHTLGTFTTFDDACKAAREWIDRAKGGVVEDVTVAETCRRYVEDRRKERGEGCATDAGGRFERLVYGKPIGRIKLSALRTAHLTDWRNAQVSLDEDDEDDSDALRRARNSANRNLGTLKAALNLAFKHGLAHGTAQWDRVANFEKVSKRRERFLTRVERKALFAAASPQLKKLIRGLLLTAARPGELAAANVGDLDASGVLTLQGKTGRRTVPLGPDAYKHLAACAGERPSDSPLIVRDDGERWTRYYWRDEVQVARQKAGLPDDVVLYTLRHCAISEMLVGGIDAMQVARIAGTSVEMISKHYGHLIKDKIVAQLAKIKMI